MFRLWVSAETLIGLLKEWTMNDEWINGAIAEHFGWRFIPCNDDGFGKATGERWLDPDGDIGLTPPDYSSDLNAMHEAEKVAFGSSKLWDAFLFNLLDAVGASGMNSLDGMTCLLRATARHRAEAFLRTVGKWRGEETNP
jgi:hypothetical protein